MGIHSNLRLNEKLAQIRKAKGLSQASLAEAVDRSIMHISRIERGETECEGAMLETIKKVLDIENAPLTEPEIELFEGRLWVLDNLLNANRLHDARNMSNEMSTILELPFEKNLSFIYLMLEFRVLAKEFNPSAKLKTMEKAEVILETMGEDASPEALYLYHRNKGLLCIESQLMDDSLAHYLKAASYVGTKLQLDPSVFMFIANCYSDIGKPYYALLYCIKAKESPSYDRTNPTNLAFDVIHAHLLERIGHIAEAIDLLDILIAHAKKLSDHLSAEVLAAAHHALYNCYKQRGDYKQAILQCDEALKNMVRAGESSGTSRYAQLLVSKAYCSAKLKQFEQCNSLVEEGLAIAQENEMIVTLFKSISCINNMKDSSSIDYLENIALPYFMSIPDYAFCLDICDELEAHYKKSRSKLKALTIAAIMRDIYQKILYPER